MNKEDAKGRRVKNNSWGTTYFNTKFKSPKRGNTKQQQRTMATYMVWVL